MKTKEIKGITLITLAVTIVVLLILAGISINTVIGDNGIIKKGIIIRHLILPNYMQNTKNILKWIKQNLGDNVYISVMAQYFPTYNAKNIELLNRKITKKEYKIIENFLYTLNFKNGYIQELGEHEEEYVPDF